MDTSRPSIARVYDVLLGGKDNFQVDRDLCAQLVRTSPELPEVTRENRRWLARVVRWLTRDEGVDQFLDLGSGLPTADNTHEIAQRIAPDATVVYVDDDPAVSAYGRVLLDDDEHTYFCAADLTRPGDVLDAEIITTHLDLGRPVAVFLCLTLHHMPNLARLQRVMAEYVARLAPGSFVAITHGSPPTEDSAESRQLLTTASTYRNAISGFTLRAPDEIRSLLPGLDLVDPGVVPITRWRPDGPRLAPAGYMTNYLLGGVGRKP